MRGCPAVVHRPARGAHLATALSSRPIVPPEPRADLREPRSFGRRLLAASGVSGLIYALYVAFVAFLPYRLAMPGVDIFDVLGGNVRGRALYCGAILALFAAAVAVWDAVARSDESPRLAYRVVVPPVLFAILLTVTQPLNSRDLFHYILEGRILGSHASNPFLLPPAAFPNDPLYVYSNWRTYPAPYGPLWVLPAAGLTLLAGDSLFWSVVLFKLLALAAYLACGALLWGLLRRAGQPPLPGLVLWLWN